MPAEPSSLRQQVASLPAPVMAACRSRYASGEGVGLAAMGLMESTAAAIRAEGEHADARAVWIRLADDCGRKARPSAEVSAAAAALAGLAMGLRPQGFDRLDGSAGRGSDGVERMMA